MRWAAILIAGSLASLCGCNLFQTAAHNLVNEPIQYIDEKKLSHRLRGEARAVWAEESQKCPGTTYTIDYVDGFLDGYVDHLDNGGPPQPPAVPPLRYRRSRFLTPEGHALIRDYLTGFKHGAEVAANSGHREFLTVPVVLPVPMPEQPLQINTENLTPTPESGEKLPPPRVIEPKTSKLSEPGKPPEPRKWVISGNGLEPAKGIVTPPRPGGSAEAATSGSR